MSFGQNVAMVKYFRALAEISFINSRENFVSKKSEICYFILKSEIWLEYKPFSFFSVCLTLLWEGDCALWSVEALEKPNRLHGLREATHGDVPYTMLMCTTLLLTDRFPALLPAVSLAWVLRCPSVWWRDCFNGWGITFSVLRRWWPNTFLI